MQAVFNASITAQAGVPALFNTPEASSAPAANSSKTVHRFEPTPPMATYLVGAVIGDLEKVEGVFDSMTGVEVPVRVWGRKGMASALALARDSAIAALRGARRPAIVWFLFDLAFLVFIFYLFIAGSPGTSAFLQLAVLPDRPRVRHP